MEVILYWSEIDNGKSTERGETKRQSPIEYAPFLDSFDGFFRSCDPSYEHAVIIYGVDVFVFVYMAVSIIWVCVPIPLS